MKHPSTGHLSNDQLIDALYGVASHEHLDACPECQARLARMQQVQRAPAASSESDAFFHRQRREVMARMASPEPSSFAHVRAVWLPAAMAALLAVGVMLSRPGKTPTSVPAAPAEAVVMEASDAGWFEDVYSEMQGSEPRALSPMRSLFVEGAVNQ
jgi:anti-sigma factor RsiW